MILNKASDMEVAALRADPKNIKYIECDSAVSTTQGDSVVTTQVPLSNCPKFDILYYTYFYTNNRIFSLVPYFIFF